MQRQGKLLPDVEEEGTTGLPTGEGGASKDDTPDDETVVVNNVPVQALDNLYQAVVTSRSGRVVSKPQRLIEEIGAMSAQGWVQAQQFEIALTNAELGA
jgi:hypothetical protein